MTDGMNWGNTHLEQIKPVTAFNLDDNNEFLKWCHNSNFQPLLATENILKKDKWNDNDNKFWLQKITNKEYLPLYIPK